MRARCSWTLHEIGAAKEAEQERGVKRSQTLMHGPTADGGSNKRKKERNRQWLLSLLIFPPFQLTAVAAQVGHAGGLQLRGGAEHCWCGERGKEKRRRKKEEASRSGKKKRKTSGCDFSLLRSNLDLPFHLLPPARSRAPSTPPLSSFSRLLSYPTKKKKKKSRAE